MDNYFGAKTSAWTARSGVVVDLDPPMTSRSGSARPPAPEMRSAGSRDISDENYGMQSMPMTGVVHNGNYGIQSGSLPIMDAPIPSNMFNQAVNFDTALQNQMMPQNTSEGQLDRSLETSMDILEQQQAMEQARLLQRFKELRQMQLQQQEMLMQQQKNQLDVLKEEQKQVQTLLAKQRQNKWGGKPNGAIGAPSNCRTPPLRKNPNNMNSARTSSVPSGVSSHVQTSGAQDAPVNQSTGQLPRPVIYVPLDEDNDEIKTNPDLFSDTNSYVGSQATTEEGIYPVPDSASEVSGDVYRISENKKKPLKCPPLKPIKHHKEITKDHGSEFHDISRTIDLESDEGRGTQSLRSTGQMDQRYHGDEEDDIEAASEDNSEQYEEDDELEEQFLDDEDEEVDEDIEEGDMEGSNDEDEEEDQQDTTCIEKDEYKLKPEDRPITGLGVKKTFEELLEEQLKAEEEKLKEKGLETSPTNESPRREFLRKGVGLSRFGLTGEPKQPVKTLNKATVKSTLPEGARVTSKNENKSKNEAKNKREQKGKVEQLGKGEEKGKMDQKSKLKQQPVDKKGAKTSPRGVSSSQNAKKSPSVSPVRGQIQTTLKLNTKTTNQKYGGKDETTAQQNKNDGKKMADKLLINKRTRDPLSDDASFIDKIEQRERSKELEQEDLEEFEMLEDFADNASFCSNSSIVKKVLERDHIRSRLGKIPQSPRCSVAKQIELASKKEEVKNRFEEGVTEDTKQEISKYVPVKTKNFDKDKIDNVPAEVGGSDSDQLSDSSEEDSSESEEESSNSSENSDEEVIHDTRKNNHETNKSNSSRTRADYDDRNESSSDEDEETSHKNLLKSPSKVMTRKIASKDDRSTLNAVSNLLQKLNSGNSRKTESHDESLNSSSFAPVTKSPIVISRDVMSSKGAKISEVSEAEETDFQLHSQFSSHPKHSSPLKMDDDKSDSEMSETSSYRALNISSKYSKVNTSKGSVKRTSSSALSKSKDIEFDDEEEWGETTLREKGHYKNDSDSEELTENKHSRDIKDGVNDVDGTPPTSKLVTKLFPKLKPQPTKQQIQEQQQLQVANAANVGDGVQSKILREKLAELEKEIEKFRNENAALERQRKEREEGLSKLKKEMVAFEKEKNEELNRIQEYKNEEMKKIRHEKKMFEKYQKASRNLPDKKEREEITMLRNQLSELQEEMKRKESRWSSSNSRLKSKLEQAEQENTELKEEIKMMEKKRLEWLQKEQTANKVKSKPQQSAQKSYLQDVGAVSDIQKTSADFQTTDSDEEKDPVRDQSGTSSLPQPSNQPSMRLNQARPEVSVKGQIPSLPTGHNIRTTSQASSQNTQVTTQTKVPLNKPSHQIPVQRPNVNSWSSSAASGGVGGHMSRAGSHTSQPIRMSLMEDTPRQEPTVSAVPQDVSFCGDSDGAVMMNNNSIPRKKASKFSVDKSAIDKGNSGYEEVQHTDGKVERIYSTGAREILFSNGTRKEISADGQSIVVSFFNGDMKQIMPDQTVKYYYAEAQTTHSTYPDGLEILQFPNNQVEKHYPDGTKEIIFPDQTIKYLFPNGSEESIFPDGTVIRVDKSGDKTMEFPNGQREIHTQEYKRREYPDGTVKTVYPDGRQETRYSNGRIRVKDRDGNVIIDRRC